MKTYLCTHCQQWLAQEPGEICTNCQSQRKTFAEIAAEEQARVLREMDEQRVRR